MREERKELALVIPAIDLSKLSFKSSVRYGWTVGTYSPSKDGSLYNMLVSSIGAKECCQLYLGGHASFVWNTITPEDRKACKEYCEKHNKTFYIHAPVNANLSKGEGAKITTCSRRLITHELKQSYGIPCSYVLHIGKEGKDLAVKGTLEKAAEEINSLITTGVLTHSTSEKIPYRLVLENAAGQAGELGKSWDEIRKLYEALDKTRVGMCIDTQHAFAAGLSSFETHESVVRVFQECSDATGRQISLIHLNDSLKQYGSRVDRHAPLGKGYIWGLRAEGLSSLVKMCSELRVDMITETSDPVGDDRVIEGIRKTIA